MLEHVILNYKPIGKILLIIIVFIIINVYIFYGRIKKHLDENWKTYRQNPLILPIAGLIKRKKGETVTQSTIKNLVSVLYNIVKQFLKILMIPVYAIINIFLKLMKIIGLVLNKIRGQITVVRNILFKLFEQMYIRLQNGIAAITFFFLKLREGLKRSFGLFNLVIYSIEHSYMFFQSMMNGPVGSFGKVADVMGFTLSLFALGPFGPAAWKGALCFHPDTLIKLSDDSKINIKDIKIGDILEDGCKVLATINAKTSDKIIYQSDNIQVTGGHIVKYKNKWIRVKYHPSFTKKEFSQDDVVCLITDTGTIKIDNFIFKDYNDSNDKKTNRIVRKMVESYLNREQALLPCKCADIVSGFIDHSSVDSTDILGLVKIAPDTINVYKLNDTILSGNILVKENNKWIRVCNSINAVYIGKNVKPCVHFITNSGIIKFKNGVIIRDFMECRNWILNHNIDNLIDTNLNK